MKKEEGFYFCEHLAGLTPEEAEAKKLGVHVVHMNDIFPEACPTICCDRCFNAFKNSTLSWDDEDGHHRIKIKMVSEMMS